MKEIGMAVDDGGGGEGAASGGGEGLASGDGSGGGGEGGGGGGGGGVGGSGVGTDGQPPAKKRRRDDRSFRYYSVPRHTMFGCVEPNAKTDAYGKNIPEHILTVLNHISRVSRRGRGGRRDDEDAEKDEGKGAEEEEVEVEGEVPTKLVAERISLQVRCETPLVDMEGRSDGPSARNTLAMLDPQRVLVAYGPSAASVQMRKYWQDQYVKSLKGAHEEGDDVAWAPSNGAKQEVTLDTMGYDVMLNDALVANLNFHAVGHDTQTLQVAYVSGTLQRATDMQSKLPLLHPLAAEEVQGHQPVLISNGMLKILKLKGMLDAAKIACEVRGAGSRQQLVCRSAADPSREVAVRQENGQLALDGDVCAEYFVVRSKIYEALTMC